MEHLSPRQPLSNQATSRFAAHYIDHATEAIVIADCLSGNIVLWNPAAERLFGYRADEVIGKPVEVLVPPSFVHRHRQAVSDFIVNRRGAVIDSGSPIEFPAVHRDGTMLNIELSLTQLESEPGQLLVLAAMRSLSHPARALMLLNDRLARLTETSTDAVITIGRDGAIQTWNRSAEELFGYSAAEMLGKSITSTASATQRFDIVEVLSVFETGERLSHREHRVVARDGAIVHVIGSAHPLRDVFGHITAVECVIRDVTGRVQAEQALRESESRYRRLVEQLPVVVYMVSPGPEYAPRYMSPRADDLLGPGARQDFLAGRWDDRLHPDDLPKVNLENDLAAELMVLFRAEYRLRGDDGHYHWLRDECEPVFDEHGEPVAWQGVLVDITEQREMQRALENARDAADQSNRLKSAFLSTMSHELRTPLNAIMGYSNLLLDGFEGELTRGQQEALHHVVQGADHLLTLVNDVLDLSRIESDMFELNTETVNLPELLEVCRAELAPLAEKRGLVLTLDAPATFPPVTGDATRLRQIVLNLIGNAIKFTDDGEIRLSMTFDDRWARIAVRDTGIGIPPEALPIIFNEFQQADPGTARQHGGAGLGLAISRRLAEMHGGAIEVESTPGLGSIFTLVVPLAGTGRSAG